jgi:hypothetical protein
MYWRSRRHLATQAWLWRPRRGHGARPGLRPTYRIIADIARDRRGQVRAALDDPRSRRLEPAARGEPGLAHAPLDRIDGGGPDPFAPFQCNFCRETGVDMVRNGSYNASFAGKGCGDPLMGRPLCGLPFGAPARSHDTVVRDRPTVNSLWKKCGTGQSPVSAPAISRCHTGCKPVPQRLQTGATRVANRCHTR